jgi:VWFA-related protein
MNSPVTLRAFHRQSIALLAVLACFSPARVSIAAAAAQSIEAKPDARVDVVVRDRRGRVVRNLNAADFAVQDGAGKLDVVAVKLVEGGETAAPHLVSLVFQQMSGESAEISRDAALAVVSGARGGVNFAVFLIDKKLSVLQPFTTNPKAVRAAIELATGKKRSAKESATPEEASTKALADTMDRILRAADRVASSSRVPPSFSSLLGVARGQAREPGRKAAVYFSEGLPIADTNDEAFRTIVSAANLANVSIYTVDASGLAISKEEEIAREHMSQSLQPHSTMMGGSFAAEMAAYATSNTANGTLRKRESIAPPVLAELANSTGGFTISKGDHVHAAMQHIVEDLSAYYELTYKPLAAGLDGRYHTLQVSAKAGRVQSRNGYYAMPDLPGATVSPFELPLLDILHREPVHDFPHRVALYYFRSADGARQLVDAAVEVSGQNLQFDDDASSGLSSAHLTMLGVVRDHDGDIVERFTADQPMQYPPHLLDQMRERPVLFQSRLDLAPGNYTLEIALQDMLAGKFSTSKSEFTVAAASRGFGVSSLAIVRSAAAAPEASESDDMFAASGKSVTPALDGAVTGGKSASAEVYFRLYPSPGAASPIDLDFNVTKDGKPVLHSPLKVDARNANDLARVVALDVSQLDPGDYDLRLTSKQGGQQAEEHARLVIRPATQQPAASESANKSNPGGEPAEVEAKSLAELPSAPPTPEQQRLLEQTRDAAMKYTEKLPNFLCTQVTRRMLDPRGRGQWRSLDESAQLITFFDGREHYQEVSTRRRPTSETSLPPSLTSTGEFGSLLKEIFVPEAQARFGWMRTDNIRGRPVEVLTYSVEAEHSKYAVAYHGGVNKPPVFSAYHGQLFVDASTGAVMRVTHETGTLPSDMPMHHIGLVVDYDYTAIGGHLYLVPVTASLEVHHRKNTVIRNEVNFRAYQRFTVDSRVLPYVPPGE